MKTLALLRITVGWLFFWAFLDKVFGLGFATEHGKSWIDGVSPTAGFLGHATKGPFVGMFHALAGSAIIDWLFMLGLLCIGLSLILGIFIRIAGYSGMILVTLMFLGLLPPTQNPLIDEHVIYFLVLFLFTQLPVGDTLGFGKWWKRQGIVERHPVLQ